MFQDYTIPPLFKDDLFNLLSAEDKHFPHRYISIGSARSGSNIRVNPVESGMWSALIHGHVKWVLIHPDAPRAFVKTPKSQEGIHPNEAITWFSTVYKRISQGDWPFGKYPVTLPRAEGSRYSNDWFLPGWWYATISKGYTTAISHLFCSPVNLASVYPAIRKKDPTLARTFLEK
ncbi:JmjC domain protein [Oesophagostomum dentatum]|uniref:JmjC domain protein n=1 Tax=Oesophagostomum dentatum TaxID=61180 RepID=A0A0B1SLL2_OESDE|nr:JmjC domain protein [Oesophagostomum dentatum]